MTVGGLSGSKLGWQPNDSLISDNGTSLFKNKISNSSQVKQLEIPDLSFQGDIESHLKTC